MAAQGYVPADPPGIGDVTGLQAALDAKADDLELAGLDSRVAQLEGDTAIGAWMAPDSIAAGAVQTADATMDPAASRLEPGDLVRLRGALDGTGGGVAGNSAAMTLPAAHRPLKVRRTTTRVGTAQTRLTINPDGTLVCNSALAAGGQLLLDGVTFTR